MAAQNLLDENLKLHRARLEAGEERVFLLSGILRCGTCGRPLVGSSAHKEGKVYRYYVHRRIEGETVSCPVRTVSAEAIEQKILDHLDKRLSDDGYLLNLGERAIALTVDKSKNDVAEKGTREKELLQAERDIENAFAMLGSGGPSDQIIQVCKVQLEKLQDKKQKIEARLRELSYKIEQGTTAEQEMTRVQQSLELFQKAKKNGSRKALKRILNKVFTNIRVDAGRLALSYWTASTVDMIGFDSETKKAPDISSGAVLCFPSANRPIPWDQTVDFLQFRKNGRDGRIRTCDPLVPNQMR